jgi:hypothetical protein
MWQWALLPFMTHRSDLKQKFFQGDYRAVLSGSVDSTQPAFSAKDVGWVIGALSFLGRLDEANVLYESRKDSMSEHERIQSRFFLGVALSRQSRSAESRRFFGLNLKEGLGRLPFELRFFAYQGLAFNRYFSGRFAAAGRASNLAFAAAMEGDFLFGKVLAADIRGHILVHLGEIAEGLKLLQRAQEWAELLNNQAAFDAIQISILTYRAQFGLQPKTIQRQLSSALKRLSPQDTYSKPSLLLELARQCLLRGQISKAYESLDSAAEIIYSTQNRRQEVLLNQRYAYLHYLKGESTRALTFIRSARKSLNLAVDRALESEVLGLEVKIATELKKTDLHQSSRARLERMAQIYGGAVSKSILFRETENELELRKGSDPLGELLNRIKRDPDSAIDEVLDSGYYSFLHEILEISRGRSVLYLELAPGSVTVFDKGEVFHAEGLTPLLRAIAAQLARGDGSKKELVEEVWSNVYHPLRHDSVVYSAVTAFRKILGDHADWIETTENGYRYRDGVMIQFHQNIFKKSASKSETEKAPETQLNLRQLKVLKYLLKNESLDARTLKKVFRVSEITASRDLAYLTMMKLVVRVGRGRSTRYLLPENAEKLIQ